MSQQLSRVTVALTRCDDYSTDAVALAIENQFELFGGLQRFVSRGETVLLKPNFIAPKPRRRAVQTDPEVILATARLLRDLGAKPFVGDSPAWGNVFTCVNALELQEPLKKLDVPVKQLNKPVYRRVGPERTKVGISSVALAADKIINLPKLKTHQQLVATFAVKNMFGCVSGKAKAFWHFAKGGEERRFCRFLIEIYKMLNPVVTIIDAVAVMEGAGPIRGNPRNLSLLIGGTDAIACEAVCAKLVNIKPDDLPILRTAGQIGFGCSDLSEIQLLGANLDDFICTDFLLAEPVPIRFSLLRVCKSICKQIILFLKGASKSSRGRGGDNEQ